MNFIALLCAVSIFICPVAFAGGGCDPACLNGGTCVSGECECTCFFAGAACEIPLIDAGWTAMDNGYQYMKTTTAMTWFAAASVCWLHCGNLAFQGARDDGTFTDLVNAFVTSNTWMGLVGIDSHWRWMDDIDLLETWKPWDDTVDDTLDTKRCGAMQTSGAGVPKSCDKVFFGLCEKPIGNPPRCGRYDSAPKTYFLTPAPTMYGAAEIICEQFGAHLAVLAVQTTSTLETIMDNLAGASGKTVYVGYEDMGTTQIFNSIIGGFTLPVGDPRWRSGQPNNADPPEDCVATKASFNGLLRDTRCDKLYYGLCEKAIMPSGVEICPSGKICENGICVKYAFSGKEACQCNAGYYDLELIGNCTDINECIGAPCSSNSSCVNMPGSYVCM